MIIEAEKPHDQQLAGWRPRRADSVVTAQVWVQIPRTQLKDRQAERERILPFSTFSFFSGLLQWIGWSPSTPGRAICFAQSTSSDLNLIKKHPHRCTRIRFKQVSGCYMAESDWHITIIFVWLVLYINSIKVIFTSLVGP